MKARLTVNIDDAHFFHTRSVEEMTVEGCKALVDAYAGTSVCDLVFCAVAKRIAAPVEVSEWETIDIEAARRRASGEPLLPGEENHLALADAGIDPYAVWIARARQHGIGAWIGIRMNDDHHYFDLATPRNPVWWREHPEFWRRPYDFERNFDRAFDYRYPEIRARMLRCISAFLDRYEPDGIELDWMRRAWHFAPGYEREGAEAVTGLLREVRALCSANGRKIAVAVRVPPAPWDCEGFGLDVVRWAREGLVDRVIPSPDMCVWDELPVELWKELLAGTGVLLAPGVGAIVRAIREKPHLKNGARRSASPEILSGLAAQYFARGGDLLHAFNLFDRSNALGATAYGGVLRVLGDPDALATAPRRHVVTYNDTPAPGCARNVRLPQPCGPCGNGSPWSDLSIPDTAEFRMHLGRIPSSRRAEIRLAFAGCSRADGNVWDGMISVPRGAVVRLNGVVCECAGPADGLAEPVPDEDLWIYPVPAGALHDGPNMIEVRTVRAATIEWAEIAFL